MAVGARRDFRRASAFGGERPMASGAARSRASRIELYQASRCMALPLPAIGETDR
jgi:hypothetical protein